MVCSSCGNNIDGFLNDEMVCPYCHEDISKLTKEYTNKEANYDIEGSEKSLAERIDADISSNRPISVLSFMLMQALFFIPILNLLFLFIFSFIDNINKNRKAFARSILTWYALLCTAIISLITAMLILKYPLDLTFWFNKFKDFVNNLEI